MFRKVYKDDINYRCEHFFWRIWNNPTLSQLSDEKLKELWFKLQTPSDLAAVLTSCSPTIRGGSGSSDDDDAAPTELAKTSTPSDTDERSSSVSPTNIDHLQSDANVSGYPDREISTEASITQRERPPAIAPRPSLTRNTSGKGKRTTFAAGTKPAKSRPTPPRKRSSQLNSGSMSTIPIRPILRSPQVSSVDVPQNTPQDTSLDAKSVADPRTARISPSIQTGPAPRQVPGFQLGSPDEASSWQSTDSNIIPDNARPGSAKTALPLQIEPNFRQMFQKQKSSTALAAMTGSLQKTGSVVRFADEARDISEFKTAKGVGIQSRLRSSEGALPMAQGSWREKSPLQHRDSIGSVAAISDNSDEEADPDQLQMGLPRVKSGLSLAMDALKHTRTNCDSKEPDRQFTIVTSPQIEAEQEALISGKKGRKQTDEELKLLEMGHRDGVTKAGGVKSSRLTGNGKGDTSSELPEMRIF